MAPAQTIQVKDLPDELRPGVPSAESPATAAAMSALSAVAPSATAAPVDAPLPAPGQASHDDWERSVEQVALGLIRSGETDVMHHLTQRFERAVITAALTQTHGRRIEAAQKLGIGRNTITRKIQELGMED